MVPRTQQAVSGRETVQVRMLHLYQSSDRRIDWFDIMKNAGFADKAFDYSQLFATSIGTTEADLAKMVGRIIGRSVSPPDASDVLYFALQSTLEELLATQPNSIRGALKNPRMVVEIAGLSISVVGTGDGQSFTTLTAVDGKFSFLGLTTGTYDLRINLGGTSRVIASAVSVSSIESTILADIELAESTSATFLVDDLTGAAVESASISVYQQGSIVATVQTDS